MLDNFKNIFKEETEYIETQELDEIENEVDESFKVDDINTTSSKTRASKSIVKVFEPVTKSAAPTIIDAIKRGELCVVNFSKVSDEEAKVIYSTLSGSIYSLDGVLKMIDSQIMLCAPKNFLIDGDLSE